MIDTANIALAALEGLALILSPCILPVLPLMLGASLDGGKIRPLGIVAGFVTAFTVFALVSRTLLQASGLDAGLVRYISLVLLMVFGLVMLFPQLSDKWSTWFQKFGGGGNDLIDKIKGRGFWGGFGIGLLIGVVWTPCAGPILAVAIIQIIQADNDIQAFATIAGFSIGAAIPMFIIAMSGRYVMNRLGFLKRNSYAIRRVIGAIMIAAALIIFTGLDLKLVALSAPSADSDVGQVEKALSAPVPAAEIVGITNWINSEPLTLAQLKGKVVLIDFWTYSCINCIRTLPHVTAWYDKYKNDGLVVIGVHAPEFAFERKLENVQNAVKEYKINYPVALDNNFTTWRAYNNRYWPAHYLIDKEGQVVYTHFGEGDYDRTESNIRALLGLPGKATGNDKTAVSSKNQSPETYLGYARAKNFASNEERIKDAESLYSFPKKLGKDEWALSGNWIISADKITTAGDGTALRYNFRGGKVYLVMGSADGKPISVQVMLDGAPAATITVRGQTLYTLTQLADDVPQKGILDLRPERAGLEAYAFTFGK